MRNYFLKGKTNNPKTVSEACSVLLHYKNNATTHIRKIKDVGAHYFDMDG